MGWPHLLSVPLIPSHPTCQSPCPLCEVNLLTSLLSETVPWPCGLVLLPFPSPSFGNSHAGLLWIDLHQEGPGAVCVTGLPDRAPHPIPASGIPCSVAPWEGLWEWGLRQDYSALHPPQLPRRWALPRGVQDSASSSHLPQHLGACTQDPSHPHTPCLESHPCPSTHARTCPACSHTVHSRALSPLTLCLRHTS